MGQTSCYAGGSTCQQSVRPNGWISKRSLMTSVRHRFRQKLDKDILRSSTSIAASKLQEEMAENHIQ